MINPEYDYIDTDEQLVAVVAKCREAEVVSVDTEFARSHTYYPEVGLIQLYDGETCSLIDPVPLSTLAPLAGLLQDEQVVKVLHACSEDLEVFQCAIGVVPVRMFDTQIAAAVLGVGFSISYQGLVEHQLGLAVPKEETRSDWLQRPLSSAQLDYAALDVIYLLDVYVRQQQLLEEAGRLAWVEEECSSLADEIPTAIPPDAYYLRVKSASRLNPFELNVLRALCAWRERRARELDVPRNRVVEEKALVSIAREDVRNRQALIDAAGMTHRQVRKYGDELLDVIEMAWDMPDTTHPASLEEGGERVTNERIRMLKRVVNERAEALNIAPEMLAKRRQLEQLLRSETRKGEYELPGSLLGWREKAIGQPLLAALAEES